MKAEIIDVPKKTDVVLLFSTGLTFMGQEVYLKSSGNASLDECNREDMYDVIKLDNWGMG